MSDHFETEVKFTSSVHTGGVEADGIMPDLPVISVEVKENSGATADGIMEVPAASAEEAKSSFKAAEDEPVFDVSAIVGAMKSFTVDESAPKPQNTLDLAEPVAVSDEYADGEAVDGEAESAVFAEGDDLASGGDDGFIPDGPVTIIGVRFRPAGKMYYFSPGEYEIKRGMNVIVETARGVEFGMVAAGPMTLGCPKFRQPLRVIRRIATEEDAAHREENLIKERKAYQICQEKIAKHGLEMKLISAEYSFDDSKIMFYFTADGRVDFRDLVKELAGVFRTRIELRQIGVRDETRILGGYGICGRPLCCASYLSDFIPVSIKMAKEQNLSLNPTKISGVCGRLMCCLKNEEETYEELNRNLPGLGDEVEGRDGLVGEVESVNVLRQTIRILVEVDDEKELHEYGVGDFTIIRKRRRGGKGGNKENREQESTAKENAPKESSPRDGGSRGETGQSRDNGSREETGSREPAGREKTSERRNSERNPGGRRGRRGQDPARAQRSADPADGGSSRRSQDAPRPQRGPEAAEAPDGMFGHAYRTEEPERKDIPAPDAQSGENQGAEKGQGGAPRRRRRDFRRRRGEGNRDASSR